MPRFKCDEIEEAGFYWMKKSGSQPTVVNVKNIPLMNGNIAVPMWHILAPGRMGWEPLHTETLSTFHGPIKAPRGFAPLEQG